MPRENEEYLCGRTEAGKYASILIPRQITDCQTFMPDKETKGRFHTALLVAFGEVKGSLLGA